VTNLIRCRSRAVLPTVQRPVREGEIGSHLQKEENKNPGYFWLTVIGVDRRHFAKDKAGKAFTQSHEAHKVAQRNNVSSS